MYFSYHLKKWTLGIQAHCIKRCSCVAPLICVDLIQWYTVNNCLLISCTCHPPPLKAAGIWMWNNRDLICWKSINKNYFTTYRTVFKHLKSKLPLQDKMFLALVATLALISFPSASASQGADTTLPLTFPARINIWASVPFRWGTRNGTRLDQPGHSKSDTRHNNINLLWWSNSSQPCSLL